MMSELTATQRRDLMEIVDDRHDRGSIILASQIPLSSWHRAIGDSTYSEAILDRIVHVAYRIELQGDSCENPLVVAVSSGFAPACRQAGDWGRRALLMKGDEECCAR